ncbi:expansin EXLX1 family cellulose-binding protein [Catenuloplanes indicus]|uniref:Expansin (Peptidoglycan-binding protein) n=1 Tax=Catenuloplanes indicus TaxID=137267 RepID=A0AAE3VYH4_9ACTN|nr:expansin EXLX1 family cellulose-binding protein [Catenuloplanes indicus]MDQ0366568.1 expansin (peptidoglycan-binding protein) [Catenuloplanes indicus]
MHDETTLLSTLPGKRRRPRSMVTWLAAAGVAALAGVVGLALMLQTGSSAACAAALSGKATFYDIAGGGGNCSYDGPPADLMHVAMGPGEYADAAACGGYLNVTGPKGSVRVKVVDQCPECAAGHIDLSKEAFAKIGNPVDGIIPVTYTTVANPPLPGPLTFRVKEGASQHWFSVRIDNTGNALRSVQAKTAGGNFVTLQKYDYNYWQADSGLGPGPFTIRATDTQGNTATVDGVKLAPGSTQSSGVKMYGAGANTGSASGGDAGAPAAQAAPAPAKAAPKSASPSPSASASASVSPSASASPSATAGAEIGVQPLAAATLDVQKTSCG